MEKKKKKKLIIIVLIAAVLIGSLVVQRIYTKQVSTASTTPTKAVAGK